MNEDFDESELREAEALARALERGHAEDGLPEDALQIAALIRYSEDGGALAEGREDAVLAEVLEVADRIAARPRRAPAIVRWLFGGLGLAAAALVLLIVLTPERPPATALPAPSMELLEAQLARGSEPTAEARFDDAMRGYRGQVYAALEARYEAR